MTHVVQTGQSSEDPRLAKSCAFPFSAVWDCRLYSGMGQQVVFAPDNQSVLRHGHVLWTYNVQEQTGSCSMFCSWGSTGQQNLCKLLWTALGLTSCCKCLQLSWGIARTFLCTVLAHIDQNQQPAVHKYCWSDCLATWHDSHSPRTQTCYVSFWAPSHAWCQHVFWSLDTLCACASPAVACCQTQPKYRMMW